MVSSNFYDAYKKLNPQQKIAVDTIDGPVLVIAGPGTGKTQVLTTRIANILLNTDISGDNILALTFTESGVTAMKERLMWLIGKEAYRVNINTFHSFASDIIKQNPDEFFDGKDLEPLSDLERIYFFKKLLEENNLKSLKPFGSPLYYMKTAISKIKDLKRENINPQNYLKLIEKDTSIDLKQKAKNKELALIYEKYQNILLKSGRYDFEDMINFVIDKFNADSEFLRKYQEKYQYILIDEFQDTNNSQAELIYLLASFWEENPNLFVVGDDDQAIYRFQGASVENINKFISKYPNSAMIYLKDNYRSSQSIIDATSAVIANNKNRISNYLKIDKTLTSASKQKNENIVFGNFQNSFIENYYIAEEIQELIGMGVDPKKIAILYRNNTDSSEVADILARKGIKYLVEGGENILESGIINRFLYLLKVLNKMTVSTESEDLFILLNFEFLNLNKLDVLKLNRFATKLKIDLFSAINHKKFNTIDLNEPDKIKKLFDNFFEWIKLEKNISFIEFVEKVMERSGYLDWILDQQNSYELINKVNSFISEIKRLNRSDKELRLDKFLEYIELMKENKIYINEESIEIDTNAVKIMTAHKSKGLEFDYVFLYKFTDSRWNNKSRPDLIKLPLIFSSVKDEKSQTEEDERRLLYVSLTRARKKIYITYSRAYMDAYNDKENLPSQYLSEIPEIFTESIDQKEYLERNVEMIKDVYKNRLKLSTVSHNYEEDFIKNALKEFKLSPTSFNTYLSCAYKFKLEYIFKAPKSREKFLVLGEAVHNSLEKVYRNLSNKVSQGLDDMYRYFDEVLKIEILKESEIKDIRAQGYEILEKYYNKYKEEFKSPILTENLYEKSFGWDHSVPKFNGMSIQGKIDKIAIENKKRIVLTDYKTGKPKSKNEIMGNTKYSKGETYNQVLFYRLLIEMDERFQPKDIEKIIIDYIGDRTNDPKRVEIIPDDEGFIEFKEKLKSAVDKIRSHDFTRTKDINTCQMCRFKDHCWPDGINLTQMEFNFMQDNDK